ncbi:hypothetical protein BMF94_3703 [Rhodotorula taiwanensis]|uniref:RING-type E3 ubiquitin transferase n=1 Tax=Rhodotorula taiwanensis TaxID=741276 RepID=A0A2S5B9B0_9BASI|nr:hypothetical protein BMF94_3703 [Rhodotorula taiwanensis]
MDLPGPGGPPRTVVVQQQRPSLGYFLFLSFLFYLMNQQQVQTGELIRQAGDGDQRAARLYNRHRHQLLLREARRQGIARWLGIHNETTLEHEHGDWLVSKFYPDVANGTAPSLSTIANSTEDTAAADHQAYKVTPFVPQTEGELAPVHRLVTDLFSSSSHTTSSEPTAPQLYLQNLTGFTKGHWDRLSFSYADLGLNETWTEEVEREPVRKVGLPGPQPLTDDTPADASTSLTDDEADKLERRQGDGPVAATAPADTTEFKVVTYNRTDQRGTFPWASSSASSPRSESHRATFNLRSVQTSATGPVLSLGPDHDDGELLRLKDFSSSGWADWEKLGPVVYVGGKLTLHAPPRSSSTEEELTELDIEAVHFLDSGRVYGYATPDFARARIVETISLPLMSSTAASSSASPNLTATAIGHAMLREFDVRLERDVRRLADADVVEPPAEPALGAGGAGGAGQGTFDPDAEVVPRCIFTMYGALSPLPGSYPPGAYAEWYSDLFHPTGARVREPPPSTFSAVLASPNCGLVLSIPQAKVVPTQQLWNAAAVSGAVLVLVEALILLLQVRQLERVQGRPGTIANVSHYGVVGMLFVDAYTFVTLLTLGVVFDSRASLALLASAFMSLLSSLLFGTRYIAMIREATPDRPAPAPGPGPTDSATSPLLDAAEGCGAMAALPEWARSRLNTWTLRRTRRVVGFGSVIGFGLYLLNWYGWTALILWIIYSNWIPQIVLNVWRGTARQSLADEYVIGMTIARIAPPLYFWAYDGNCLLVPTSPKVWYLAAYYAGQAFILVLQNRIAAPQHQQTRLFLRLSTLGSGGARFFISPRLAKWLELPALSSWDYHPRSLPPSIVADLRGDVAGDIETGKLTGARPATPPEPDCPICLSSIHVFPTKEEQAAGEDDVVRMAFAVTPCAHLVHTECLEQWVL